MFKKFSCVIRSNGGRFLILETDPFGTLSTLWDLFDKGVGWRSVLVFLRAFQQKDGISRKKQSYHILVHCLVYSWALEMTV